MLLFWPDLYTDLYLKRNLDSFILRFTPFTATPDALINGSLTDLYPLFDAKRIYLAFPAKISNDRIAWRVCMATFTPKAMCGLDSLITSDWLSEKNQRD